MLVTNKQQLLEALDAIAQGYILDVYDDQYIRAVNPDFDEPWDDPFIMIDLHIMKDILKD